MIALSFGDEAAGSFCCRRREESRPLLRLLLLISSAVFGCTLHCCFASSSSNAPGDVSGGPRGGRLICLQWRLSETAAGRGTTQHRSERGRSYSAQQCQSHWRRSATVLRCEVSVALVRLYSVCAALSLPAHVRHPSAEWCTEVGRGAVRFCAVASRCSRGCAVHSRLSRMCAAAREHGAIGSERRGRRQRRHNGEGSRSLQLRTHAFSALTSLLHHPRSTATVSQRFSQCLAIIA